MASVTEDSLNLAAHSIVADFIDNGSALTQGVQKKASELGLNRDQTARLIERTNSEAFLRVFPEKTDFEVADPGVILGSSEKVASEKDRGKRVTYAEYLERDPYDIFGVANEKTASYEEPYTSTRGKLVDIVYKDKLAEAERVEKTAKLIEVEEAQAKLWNVFKTAAYGGTSVADMECELLLAYPDKPFAVMDMVEHLSEKLASSLLSPEIMKRASAENFNPNKVIEPTELTLAFGEVINLV